MPKDDTHKPLPNDSLSSSLTCYFKNPYIPSYTRMFTIYKYLSECLSRSAANCNHEIFTWTASFSPELTARSATHVTWVCCCCCCCCNSTCITMRPCQ